jgi:hypothetical protein
MELDRRVAVVALMRDDRGQRGLRIAPAPGSHAALPAQRRVAPVSRNRKTRSDPSITL